MEAKQQGAKQWQIHKSQNNKSYVSLFQEICIANYICAIWDTFIWDFLRHSYLEHFLKHFLGHFCGIVITLPWYDMVVVCFCNLQIMATDVQRSQSNFHSLHFKLNSRYFSSQSSQYSRHYSMYIKLHLDCECEYHHHSERLGFYDPRAVQSQLVSETQM